MRWLSFFGVNTGMLGLATVLTDQGMEGIAAFVPPAPPRPRAPEPVETQVEDEAAEISRGTWILVGALAAAVLASGVGYWLASSSTPKPARSPKVVTRPIQDLSDGASAPVSTASAASPARTAIASDAAAPESATVPREAAPVREPVQPQRREARRPARPASESVFVANPEWTSQVRRIGEVDAETERSTMTILDTIHGVQERERQQRASAPRGGDRE